MLDRLYGHAVRARRRWYERHPAARRRLDAPVISIGNLTMGGAGKTPLVRALAEWLISRGERPSILSRGYARRDRVDGVVVVSDGARVLSDLWQSGDEPLMLARALPAAIVAVAEDRYLAGVVAEQRLGATVHILDDGFQHLRLARDLDVLVTSVGEIGSGRVLPMGRLREPGDAAARAHIVVLIGADADTARTEAWALGISQHVVARRVVAPPPPGVAPAVAVAGIANPAQFFDAITSAGWPVARTMAFRDHYQYGRSDIARIAAAVEEAGAAVIVTTEKDAVRFEPLGTLPFAVTAVPLSLAIDDWATFGGTVTAAIERRRAPAGLDA